MRFINNMVIICKMFFRFLIKLLGGFLGIIVSLVIIGLNIYVSFNHTLLLFQSVGFTRDGYMDIAAVTAIEMTFIASSILNVVNIKNRKPWKKRKVSIGVGVSGIALIMWSNIHASYAYGLGGIIIGAVIPLSIVAWELILAEVYTESDQGIDPIAVEKPIEQELPVEQGLVESTKETNYQTEIITDNISDEVTRIQTEDISQDGENHEAYIEQERREETIENSHSGDSTSIVDPSEKEEIDTNTIEAEDDAKDDTEIPVNDQPENQIEVSELTTTKLEVTQREDLIHNIQILAEEITKNIPSKSPERKKVIKKTAKMALRLYNKKGKKPTIAELIQKANCSQNIAKDVLKEVKQLTSKVS